MNSRERLLCALDHSEPDRVPLDLGTTVTTTFHVAALDAVLSTREWGRSLLEAGTAYGAMDAVQGAVAPTAPVVERLEIDTWGLIPPKYPAENNAETDSSGTRRFEDEYGVTWVKPADAHYYRGHPALASCRRDRNIFCGQRTQHYRDGGPHAGYRDACGQFHRSRRKHLPVT